MKWQVDKMTFHLLSKLLAYQKTENLMIHKTNEKGKKKTASLVVP